MFDLIFENKQTENSQLNVSPEVCANIDLGCPCHGECVQVYVGLG